MADLESYTQDFLGSNQEDQYYVACSGGVDSMVLLYLLKKLGKDVSALHVNYHLRGEDSMKDQLLIERFCKKENITCYIKSLDLGSYLKETGGNLQDVARESRYSFFETFAGKPNVKILLGHHADDQIETFFLNLARGPGMMGLACMLSKNGVYWRPFLKFTKAEIVQYAKSNNIEWREDDSNASHKYSRNKLRNVILPEISKSIPTLKESVLFLIDIFQKNQRIIETKILPLSENVKENKLISFKDFDLLNEFEIIELMRQFDLGSGIASELMKLRSSEKGKFIPLINNTFQKIIREGNDFYFLENSEIAQLPQLQIETVTQLPKSYTKDVIYLNSKLVNGKLLIRKWKNGDRMKPIGINGSKLISDILTDAKVPNHQREQQFVVQDAEKIVWCVDHTVSREAIATEGSDIIKVFLIR